MTAALDSGQRTALSSLIQKARNLLEIDLASTLEGDFGIHRSDGRIEEADALSLDASQAAVRVDLLDIVAFLRSEGETESSAVERLIREAAFTHVNRLVALRVAEGLDILPEAIGNGLSSQGFRDFAEVAPASADEDWERFRLFVRICADELSTDVPALFDPRNPLLELEPTTAAFSELIELFVAVDEAIWSAQDALGWSYQFFNSAEERKGMRESSAPRNSRELAVRNQFFTPSYVVEFLVQNSLGAHLAASYPALVDELPLLVEVPEPVSTPVDLRGVSALDPACGSGHFLLGAYDVLEAAWRHAGVEPADAAPDIVRSLWGIDIDPRATQIAQAAVIFRARRHCRAPLPTPNVICARSLPASPETDELVASLPSHVGRAVQAIADELVMAPVLGPLLKIEERLDREVRDAFGTGQVEGTLSEGLSELDAADVESLVLEALSAIADHTTSTASQRLFAAEAHDAVRFVEVMTRRYTACLMNPPFGPPVPSTKHLLNAAYPRVPKGGYLEALFLDRAFGLAQKQGSVGIVSSRSILFLPTFRDWRKDRLLRGQLTTLLDVGHGLMEQALVEAVAGVVHPHPVAEKSTVISLLRSQNRASDLLSAVQNGTSEEVEIYRVDARDLAALPTRAFAYWASDAQLEIWKSWKSLEPSWGEVRKGSWPGGDFRHLRLWWEIGYERRGQKSWIFYAKGGPYAPYYSEPHLVVNWDEERKTFWEFYGRKHRASPIPENRQYYRRQGLTWSLRTASGLSVRVLPAGCIFANKGPAFFSENDDEESLLLALAWLNSRPAKALLDLQLAAGEETSSGSASRSYEIGLLRSLPIPPLDDNFREVLIRASSEVVRLAKGTRSYDETSPHFDPSVWKRRGDDFRALVKQHLLEFLDQSKEKYDQIGLVEATLSTEVGGESDWVDVAAGPLIMELDRDVEPEEVVELFSLSEDQLVDHALSEVGGRRYLAVPSYHVDRRIDLICHVLGSSPANVVACLRREGPPAWFVTETAERLISWAVGSAFGRWDGGPDLASAGTLFAEVRRPSHGEGPMLLDDVDLLEAASSVVADKSMLDDAALALGSTGLDRYLLGQFFGDHLSRYSMSRRKAPIYWHLQVPSRKWGIWLYMPRLSREMLFAVVQESEQRQRLAEQQIATLQREYDDGGAGRTIATVSKELDAEQKLAVELLAFRDEAERIANLGWEPDLDDGAVLNAAPLAKLFSAWKDAAKYRKELKQGKHTWSTVSKYSDQL